ncbi:MAG: hypothetical protein ACR2GX_07685 [Candidatus Dormibacteria bacterium]
MNRRRLFAAIFFSGVIVAVLALIVVTELINSAATVSVYRLKNDVRRGAPFSQGDVDRVPLARGSTDFNFVNPDQSPKDQRYTLNLKGGDVLRPDDIEAEGLKVAIHLTVESPPPVNAGDVIDIFTKMGTQEVAIGRKVAVDTISGTDMTILVDAKDENAWISLSAEKTPVHIVKVTSQVGSGNFTDPTSAVGILCSKTGSAPQCTGGGGGAPTTTPAPAATPPHP